MVGVGGMRLGGGDHLQKSTSNFSNLSPKLKFPFWGEEGGGG